MELVEKQSKYGVTRIVMYQVYMRWVRDRLWYLLRVVRTSPPDSAEFDNGNVGTASSWYSALEAFFRDIGPRSHGIATDAVTLDDVASRTMILLQLPLDKERVQIVRNGKDGYVTLGHSAF